MRSREIPLLFASVLLLGTACAQRSATSEVAVCPAPVDPAVVARAASADIGQGDAERGAALFDEHCARCHAPRVAERGSRLFRSYPRLDCPAYLRDVSPGYLFTVIARGGPAVGRQKAMKPFDDQLSQQAIFDLVAHLQDLGSGTR